MLDAERYDRHFRLKGFGIEGQKKLAAAQVLVIGAGGLGCPVLQYLVAAGVGTIGIADDDVVALSNLQRQVLYTSEDVGKAKAAIAAARLTLLNPDVAIKIFPARITTANAIDIITKFQVIVDCTDNFATRYLVDDACRLTKKILVFGAVYQYEGQVAVFNMPDSEGITTSYRHLFPQPPLPSEAPDCNEAGILGVLPGTIGTLQATETIKIITGIGTPLSNKLLTLNLLDYSMVLFNIPLHIPTGYSYPASVVEFKKMNYNHHCGVEPEGIKTIPPLSFYKIASAPDTLIIDVREPGEHPKLSIPHVQIPLSFLNEKVSAIQQKNIIVICQSGKRSLAAAKLLYEKLGLGYQVSHVAGGINKLQDLKNE